MPPEAVSKPHLRPNGCVAPQAGFASDLLDLGAAQTPINVHKPMYAENNDFLDRPALDAYINFIRSDM